MKKKSKMGRKEIADKNDKRNRGWCIKISFNEQQQIKKMMAEDGYSALNIGQYILLLLKLPVKRIVKPKTQNK